MSCISYRVEREHLHSNMNRHIAQGEIDDAVDGLARCKTEMAILVALPTKVLLTEKEREEGATIEFTINEKVDSLMESIRDYNRDLDFYTNLLSALEHDWDELRIEED